MKWTLPLILVLAATGPLVHADMVELQDGSRIDGKILAENPDSIEIEIGTNPAGTIRRVLIIDASEIRTWTAESLRSMPDRGEPEEDVNRLSGAAYVEKLLADAQQKIDQRKVDDGIQQFAEAAEVAGRDAKTLPPEDRVEMLKLRSYAYRLQLVALEGKEEMLEERLENYQDGTDGLDEMISNLESDISEYQSEREDFEQKVKEDRNYKFGSKQKIDEFKVRENQLLARQQEVNQLRNNRGQVIMSAKQDLLQAQMKIELVEERIDRAEDEAKEAEKALRRR